MGNSGNIAFRYRKSSGGDKRPRTFTGKCFRAIDQPQKILLIDKIISRAKNSPVVIKKKGPANTTRPKPIKCYLHSIIRFSKNISHQHHYSPCRCSRVLLQSQKQVRIERLAAILPLPILQSSRRRHIQRFLQIKALSILVLWFPIVKEVISRQFTAGSQLVIALDRTQWKEYNVLMVSDLVQKRAFPIFWTLLDKQGASNLAEQQQVLRPVIWLLKKYKLALVGDREFHSIELAQWLHRQRLSFVLRQKCSTTSLEKRQPFQPLDSIPVQPGIHLFYPKVSFTQKKGFSRFNLVASGQRKYLGKQEDEP